LLASTSLSNTQENDDPSGHDTYAECNNDLRNAPKRLVPDTICVSPLHWKDQISATREGIEAGYVPTLPLALSDDDPGERNRDEDSDRSDKV
jgi:hypothetical protein